MAHGLLQLLYRLWKSRQALSQRSTRRNRRGQGGRGNAVGSWAGESSPPPRKRVPRAAKRRANGGAGAHLPAADMHCHDWKWMLCDILNLTSVEFR